MKEAPAEDAKAYMSSRQIPQLFESLMTGLMFHRPEDHLTFLVDCIHKVKDSGHTVVNWNAFVESKRSNSALPPISRSSKHDTSSDESDTAPARSATNELTKTSPLPPIGMSRETTSSSPMNIPPKVPIVLIMGPPGCGKSVQSQKVIDHYKNCNWVNLSVGDLIRQKIFKEGSAEQKWQAVAKLVKKGEMAQDDIAGDLLVEVMKSHRDAKGFLIQGFPRTMWQADQLNSIVGRCDLILVLDCEESVCYQRLTERREKSGRVDDNEAAIKRRLEVFKTDTAPVIGYLEKYGKLIHLQREGYEDDVFDDIVTIMDVAFFGKEPGSVDMTSFTAPKISPTSDSSRESSRQPTSSSFIMSETDEGRKPGFPEGPIIFIMGGPGCGKGSHSQRLLTKFPDAVHLSMGDILRQEISANGEAKEKMDMLCELIYNGDMAPHDLTMDLLKAHLRRHKAASAYLIEGYPRTKQQLEEFNKQIGGLTRGVLLDCEEAMLIKNVEARQETSRRQDDRPAPLKRRIEFYKNETLPVAKYLHEHGKLTVIPVDGRSMGAIQADVAQELAGLIMSADNDKSTSEESEVEEEQIVAAAAFTTGEVAVSPSQKKEDSNLSKESTDLSKEPTDLSKQSTQLNSEDMEGKTVLFVVGGPGCGKGTQCAKIVEKYGLCHLSSGDLLREEVQSGSERGKELNSIMESGALVSLDVVLTLLKEAMLKNKSANGFLIDGYPRELEQGTRFESEIVPPTCVLYFEVPDDVMVERLLERAKTSGRVDDNEETIKKRLKTFHDHCDNVLEHYEGKSLLCKIDGRGSVDDIFGEVVKAIDSSK